MSYLTHSNIRYEADNCEIIICILQSFLNFNIIMDRCYIRNYSDLPLLLSLDSKLYLGKHLYPT